MAITTPNHSYNFQESTLRTVCRIAPGAILWFIMFMLFFLAFYDVRAYFIFTAPFFIFNAFLLAHVGVFSHRGITLMTEADKKDYKKEYAERRRKLEQSGSTHDIYNFEDIIHYVIVPNYKEDPDTLSETMSSIADSQIAKEQIIICLAMEEREKEAADKAKKLINKFSTNFKDIIYTLHPPNLEGEQAGKSSNEGWAAAEIAKEVDAKKYNPEHVMISTCDADSIFHPKHYDYITMCYCLEKDRNFKIWQGPMINYKNFDSIPASTKILCTAVSLHEIACLADPTDHHIPFSSYTMSLDLASTCGGWDGDVIPEDWHMYMKCFFATAGKATIEAVPFPVQCYAVENDKSYWQSMVDRYVQAKRHAWGVSELAYFMFKVIECFFVLPRNKRPPLIKLLGLGYKAFSLHYFGALGVIIIILTGVVMQLYRFVPYFAQDAIVADAVANTWSIVFKIHNIFTIIPLILSIYANYRLVKIVISPEYGRWYHVIQWIAHWILLAPVVNFIFATYPEIWAFTRFMFTDQLVYIVASKGKAEPPKPEQQEVEEHTLEDQEEFSVVIEDIDQGTTPSLNEEEIDQDKDDKPLIKKQ